MEEFLSNPLLLLVLGYFLARWDKRGDQQQASNTSLANLQGSIEERFITVFKRLDGLDDSRRGHDEKISNLVTQVGNLCTRLDMLLGIGRADAMMHRSRSPV
jgi:hypothetical protein